MFRSMLVVLMVFGYVSAAVAEERWVGSQWARVDIDARGQVISTVLVNSTLGAAMQQKLIERINKVEFEPATLNGVAAPAQATVNISLLAQADRDGMRLLVDSVELIAGMRKSTPPRYPSRELRRGISGEAMVRADYDAEGKVLSVWPANVDARIDRFTQAALAAAKNWQFEPEQVAGIGVPGTAYVPVRFEVDGAVNGITPRGKLQFPDGGSLQLYQVAEPQWKLAESKLRVRSIASAQQAIDGGS